MTLFIVFVCLCFGLAGLIESARSQQLAKTRQRPRASLALNDILTNRTRSARQSWSA